MENLQEKVKSANWPDSPPPLVEGIPFMWSLDACKMEEMKEKEEEEEEDWPDAPPPLVAGGMPFRWSLNVGKMKEKEENEESEEKEEALKEEDWPDAPPPLVAGGMPFRWSLNVDKMKETEENEGKEKYHVKATCWIPAMDTPQKQYKYTIHDEICDSESEAMKISKELRESKVSGEIIDVFITCINNH